MDRDQQGPLVAPSGFDPNDVAASLARRNAGERRQSRVKHVVAWLLTLGVLSVVVGGAWWLSGEITEGNGEALSFLIGSDDLPEGPFTAPDAGTISYVISRESQSTGTLSTTSVTFNPIDGSTRAIVLASTTDRADYEWIIVGDQLYEREPNQQGWTVRAVSSDPLGRTPLVGADLTMLDDIVPVEAERYVQVISSARETVDSTVTRRYDLSIDQATWRLEQPASYEVWATDMGVTDAPRDGGLRIKVWVDDDGIVYRYKWVTSDGDTVETVELANYGIAPYVPTVPPQAWPVG
jgi:hypothetical protein